MNRSKPGARLALVLAAALLPLPAHAFTRSPATTFAVLPDGTAHPEGIAADRAGTLYVTTFDVSRPAGPGQLLVFAPSGRLLRQVSVAGSSQLLLGVAVRPFRPQGDPFDLLVVDFGAARVLAVNSATGDAELFTEIPDDPALPGTPGANALAFDRAGHVYVSDSFQGAVWRTGPAGGPAVVWAASPLLRTEGVPPFGANGLAFNAAESALFVANTGNDTVVRIPVSGGRAGTPEVFVNGVNGADGLFIDEADNLWIAANQADEIVVLDPTGRVVAKLGDFDGISPQGEPVGLLFPASLVRSGPFVYVTNLALDLEAALGLPTVDSQWAAQVRRHTVARIRAHIPPLRGRP
ncbi:MAG TPA: SMP-30/gluconolactonase/LRE family protein [Thermodesulfobacteriota bacterium]|nr:SMP-30/gluconolactonase/LRE family protein [Thermodesulfobacteriota bacterium]